VTFTVSAFPTPAAGYFADVSQNEASDVDPCPAGNCVYSQTQRQPAVFTVWTSGIFAPECGSLGSVIHWGGGHRAYAGNEVYRFDLATQLWSRLGSPSLYSDDPGNIDSDGAFPDGKPIAPHTYQTLGILPSANGGGTYGSLIQAGLPAADSAGNGRYGAWWKFNLSTATWSKFIDSSGFSAGTLGAKLMVQEPNGNCWWFGGGYVGQLVRVTLAGGISSYGITSNISGSSGACGGVTPTTRILALWGQQDDIGPRLRLFNLAAIEGGATDSTAVKYVSTSGTEPSAGNGMQWCPTLGRFAAKLPTSSAEIYWLTPSNVSDPWNSTWTWSTETLTAAGGASPQTIYDGSGYNGSYNRFVWCSSVNCFIWATGNTKPVQGFRPAGT
jgi:hypothetical protein